MIAEPWIVGLASLIATLSGGVVALRFHERLNSLLGLSSGAIIGVALLDLLPEAIKLGGPRWTPFALMSAVALGLAGYLLVDWLLAGGGRNGFGHQRHLGPASLAIHSIFDGFGIGVALQISTAVGLLVAAAVLSHDLLDGANTVALSLAGGAETKTARNWLVADAVAPIVGIALGTVTHVTTPGFAMLLAFFAGGFLYIGASELLPRSRAQADKLIQLVSVGLGLGLIYVIVRVSA